MLDQTRVAPLFIARYQAAVTAPSLFGAVDQPMAGGGSWFGGGSVQYDIDQLKDARRAGVDVLLVDYDAANPNASGSLLTLVQALQEMRSASQDYPLLAASRCSAHRRLRLRRRLCTAKSMTSSGASRRSIRAEAILPDAQDNAPQYIAIVNEDAAAGVDVLPLYVRSSSRISPPKARVSLSAASATAK